MSPEVPVEAVSDPKKALRMSGFLVEVVALSIVKATGNYWDTLGKS